MQKKRASMHNGPLADLFRQTDSSRDSAPEPAAEVEAPARPGKPLRAIVKDVPAPRAAARPCRSRRVRESAAYLAVIRVVGVGGAGVDAVNRMIESGIRGVEFLAVNTDAQQLALADAAVKIHIGAMLTEGLGSGSDPEVGRKAAEESDATIREALPVAPTSCSSPRARAVAPAPAPRRSSRASPASSARSPSAS